MKKQTWFNCPYPWLVSTIAFLLPSINYFVKGDKGNAAVFFISAAMFFTIFLNRRK